MEKTTLNKLIKGIDFNNIDLQVEPNWAEISNEFDIFDLSWSSNARLKSYYIQPWLCTDSWVGLKAYFLDDKFVCVSRQSGRKSYEEFSWLNKSISNSVREYLISLTDLDEEFNLDIIDDLDEEINITYKVDYNSQLLHKQAYYKNKRVDIIKSNYENECINSKNYFHTVKILTDENKTLLVKIDELDLPYNSLTIAKEKQHTKNDITNWWQDLI